MPPRPRTAVVETTKDGATLHKHPSFGIIELTAPHGSSGRLFGSPLADHPTYMRLRIWRSGVEIHRYHETIVQRDYGDEVLVAEINMSKAQFVDMITSPGNGQGTPCTFTHTEQTGALPEALPSTKPTEIEQASASVTEATHVLYTRLSRLEADLEAVLLNEGISGAKRKRILDHVHEAQRMATNLDFGMDQIKAAGDRVLRAVKIEAESVMTSVASRLGYASLDHLARTGGDAASLLEAQAQRTAGLLEKTEGGE